MDGYSSRENKVRAIYLDRDFQENCISSLVTVSPEEAKHLLVTRTVIGEQVLILNGRGIRLLSEVKSIYKKKSLELEVLEFEIIPRPNKLTLGLGLPKKEAFERSLQIAQEFGIDNVLPITCEFTQLKNIKQERLEKILIGALKQSNSPFKLRIEEQLDLLSVDFAGFKHVIYLDPYMSKDQLPAKISKSDKVLVLIGPEGGFSSSELQFLENIENLSRIKLCDTILRTETCVASALGFIHERLR